MTPIRSNREHSFDWELATVVGLEKAILLKNISYWVEENRRRAIETYFLHGTWWTSESIRSLVFKYPYFTKTSISRWMNELNAARWILSFGQTGGQNFYAPGPTFDTWNAGGDWKSIQNGVLSQNGTPPELSQNGTPLSQNGTPTVPKWDTGCPKMGHTNSNIEINVEVDVEGRRAQKRTASTSRRKSDTSMPSGGAARPTTFAGSEWAGVAAGTFAVRLIEYAPEAADADPFYYRNRCRDWSAQHPEKLRSNWIAVAAQFISDDRSKSKLVTLKSANHDSDRHTLLTNPLTGNTTNLERVNRAAQAAQRVIARRRAAGL